MRPSPQAGQEQVTPRHMACCQERFPPAARPSESIINVITQQHGVQTWQFEEPATPRDPLPQAIWLATLRADRALPGTDGFRQKMLIPAALFL
jgi:hypothetical protein